MKSFSISKEVVLEAYKQVKRNRGTAGVDSQSIEDFEKKLDGNLYKIWNRMSSGTYFPPPVRTVAIPKDDGKSQRLLGIPTVADRVAQTVVKMRLEPLVEPHFHPDSFGYRSNKSAHDALEVARERCWHHDWVIDLDIKGFFDNLDHDLVIQSVKKFTDEKWILLYIERWLKAPAQSEEGTQTPRNKGTPQGGVISPLLANIVLHLAFDSWMKERYPNLFFERYADDIIVHCVSEKQAEYIKWSIGKQLNQWKLELHPQKTKIVYCKEGKGFVSYPNVTFDFLGFTFRPRKSKSKKGGYFVGFNPAISNKAKKSIHQEMRNWKTQSHSDKDLEDIARFSNPKISGWINYYGKFCKSALNYLFCHFNEILVRWAIKKYKRFHESRRAARHWLRGIAERQPGLFAHWQLLGVLPTAG